MQPSSESSWKLLKKAVQVEIRAVSFQYATWQVHLGSHIMLLVCTLLP